MIYCIEEKQIVLDKIYNIIKECCIDCKDKIQDFIPDNLLKIKYLFYTEIKTETQIKEQVIFTGKLKKLIEEISVECNIPLKRMCILSKYRRGNCKSCKEECFDILVKILEPIKIICLDKKEKCDIIKEIL